MQFRFWGVRGSIAAPGPDTIKYGGNTPCVEVRCGDRLVIFDGGTGLRALGQSLMAAGGRVEADFFLSHLHWDHIQGIPFFTPAFVPGNRIRIYGERKGERSLQAVLEGQMSDPNFPVPLSVMRSEISFHEIAPWVDLDLGDAVRVRTAPMSHPNGCLGLRIEHGGRSLVYTTDTEHDPDGGPPDPNVVALARDADVLIYDAMYTEAQYRAGRVGWGHSTFGEALRVARAAGVGTLYFFHHDPVHSDAFLEAQLEIARRETAEESLEVVLAQEGLVFEV